ncbi:conserved protein of unknown function [Thauera humireducens]|nr:conserved protein of unknown function [Thauera humireducens]
MLDGGLTTRQGLPAEETLAALHEEKPIEMWSAHARILSAACIRHQRGTGLRCERVPEELWMKGRPARLASCAD